MTSTVDLETFRQWTFGDVRVTRIMEMAPMAFDPEIFIQATRHDVLNRKDWLYPSFITQDGDIYLHFQAFVIEAAGRTIVVDTCVGNHKKRTPDIMNDLDNPFLERLERAGFPREKVDYVLCTHLHVDHVGWNTMLVDGEWQPTFPNARYLFGRSEVAHGATSIQGDAQVFFADSVKPILDAGLADLVDTDHVVVEGVSLFPTPGHTPGHVSVRLRSQGTEAIVTGDVMHHPVQAALPEVASNFCWDARLGERTRREMLTRAAETGTVLLVAHFAGTSAVHVTPDGAAWRVAET